MPRQRSTQFRRHNRFRYFTVRNSHSYYTRTHQEMRYRTWTFTQCARKLPEFAEITQNNAITPLRVIQGHRFWYQSKAHIQLPILVINTNLPSILHSFRDTAFDMSKIAIFDYPSWMWLLRRRGSPGTISVKFYVDVNGWARYQVPLP